MPAKLTIEYVKNYIENIEGYILLSKEYIGSLKKLSIKCNKNHIFEMSFNNFSAGCRCAICSGKMKLTYEKVKNYIESFDEYKLISTSYENSMKKLQIKCPNNHLFEMDYHAFKKGCRCAECIGCKKHTYEYIKHFIESNKGYILLSTNYKNTETKLIIKCPHLHIFKMNYHAFYNGKRCPICWKEIYYSKEEKDIYKYVKSIYNGKIIENDRTQIMNPLTKKNLELDIWMPELNKAIEYNGIFWHSTEYSKYKDEQKRTQCQENGIDLLIIEEREWMLNKNFNLINNFIGV